MEFSEKFRSGIDLIYLAACALNEITPDAARVKKMDLLSVYKLSAHHSMQAISYFAIESLLRSDKDFSMDEELLSKWKEAKNKAVRKLILFDAEREKIFDFMGKKHIWYLPLKGTVLQDMYPKFGMRQMGDNDILFDENYRKEIRDFMKSEGYECEAGGVTTHDVFKKPPVLNFEMHVSLYSPIVQESWYQYYKNVKERLLPLENCRYAFTDDDFYVYVITHFYKHFRFGGSGIRSLMDVYLLNKKFAEKLDRKYISEQLRVFEADAFEQDARALADMIFDTCFDISALDENYLEMLDVVISSGVYGTYEQIVKKKLKRMTGDEKKVTSSVKFKYLMSYIFPEMEYYKEMHPFLYKYRIFIPFFVVFRIFRGLFRRGKYIRSIVSVLFKKK